jgi:hypothetical protein
MDEETFLVNRERAVDYLNSLEKVIIFIYIYMMIFDHILYRKHQYCVCCGDKLNDEVVQVC